MKKSKQKSAEQTRDIWYQLDNAARIFPSVSNGENTNVFRLACELTEPVDPLLLQQSLDTALDFFPYFQVVMRRGLFWYYLERTNLRPVVQPEQARPCSQLFYRNVKELLFRVTYFRNRVNLEVFHAVADGNGALDFLRAILYQYLTVKYKDDLPEDLPPLEHEPPPTAQAEDSFKRYYSPSETARPYGQKAYTIGGTLLPSDRISVISAGIPTKQILALAKSKNTTVTAYLTSLMICAIYEELMPRRATGRTISVIVPVDLRAHFSAETARNFFTVVNIGYNFAKNGGGFDQVLASVSQQMQDKINMDALVGRLNYNMSMQRHPLSRFTPLVLKNPVLLAAYRKAESTSTCALSNMGRITMPEPLAPYIERFSCLLNPTHIHRWKACVCSFEDQFVINFTSCIAETKAHKYFVRHLAEQGIDICITCNGGTDDEAM